METQKENVPKLPSLLLGCFGLIASIALVGITCVATFPTQSVLQRITAEQIGQQAQVIMIGLLIVFAALWLITRKRGEQ